MIYPVLGEGSSSEIFLSGIRGKYLDSRLSSLKPFPTLFKGSTRRRIEGLELIYRRAIPSVVAETLNLTRYIDKKYFLNTENRINISVSFHPTVSYWSRSPDSFLGSVARAERNPNVVHNLYRSPLREREISSNLRYSFPVIFQRGFSPFDAQPQQRYRAAHPENLYLGEIRRQLATESDVRGRTIITRQPENLLSQDWFRVISPIKFRTVETRRALEGDDRRGMTESDVQNWTIFTRAPTIIHKQLSGDFGEGSEMAKHLSTIDPAPRVVHGGPPSMSKPSFNKEEGPKALSRRIYKSGFERPTSLDFAEDLTIISAGIKTASDLAKAYRRYPELEHVEPVQTKIVREREVLKEKISEPDSGRKSIAVDLNRISDQVYSMIERRVRIERERRGLYG